MRSGIDIEGHERVDIVVDVGEVHEGACVQEGDGSAEEILLELGAADAPKLAVLLVELDVVVGVGVKADDACCESAEHGDSAGEL